MYASLTPDKLAKLLLEHGVVLYQDRSGFPMSQAQKNLAGKNYYVSEEAPRNKERVISAATLDNGLLFGLVEAIKENGQTRYRPVFFDVFGNIIHRPNFDNAFQTDKQANAAFWHQADMLDAVKITIAGAEQKRNLIKLELDDYDKLLKSLL